MPVTTALGIISITVRLASADDSACTVMSRFAINHALKTSVGAESGSWESSGIAVEAGTKALVPASHKQII
jgi:hypothetical protein